MVRKQILKHLLATTIILSSSSCKLMMMKMTGYLKNPKLEDTESIKKYAIKKNDPYTKLTIPSSKINSELITQKYPGLPTVLIYDKQFNLLENAHGEDCHKRLITFFIDSLKFNYVKIYDSSYAALSEKLTTIDIKSGLDNYDYTIVYSWTKWTPKFTRFLFKRLNEVKDLNKYKICFISLNKDWQKGQYESVPKLNTKKSKKNK